MIVAKDTLVLALNGARMGLFRNKGEGLDCNLEQLRERQQHVATTADLGSDRPGRTFNRQALGRRSSLQETDLHEQEEEHFIADCLAVLADELDGDGSSVIVVAPPKALGLARQHYGRKIESALVAEIDKDYSAKKADEISEFLSGY